VNAIDTDEVQPVFAGSALWLDCTSLVQPVDSLIQVSWYRDSELVWYQYIVNDRLISYPPNTTTGFMFHARASAQSVGQVTVWPVAPGEGGVYSCHVIMSGSDDVTDVHRNKTITVFVCELSCLLIVHTVKKFRKTMQSVAVTLTELNNLLAILLTVDHLT